MALLFDHFCLDVLALLSTVFCLVYAYFKYSFGYWTRKGVYQLEPSFPLGNTQKFLLQQESFGVSTKKLYAECKKKGVPYAGFYMFATPQLMVLDPELIKCVMSKDFQNFSERAIRENEKEEPLTGHLLALNGTKWKSMRQKLTPTFTSGKMKMMFNTLVACSTGLESILSDHASKNEDIDIKEIAGRFTTDIIGSCAFGLECNSLKDPDAEFRKFGKKVFEISALQNARRILQRSAPTLFKLLGFRQVDPEITEFFMKVVADTIDYREKNNIKRNDFLQLLINIKNTGDVDQTSDKNEHVDYENGLSLGQIAAQCFIFFLAGFETSSTAISFFLYDMAVNPDIQDKVRKEINEMFKKTGGNLTYDAAMDLQYLEQAIYESMRLHSAIPILQRRCAKDYKIPDSNVTIEKGMIVSIPLFGLNSDADHFPNPEKYDPERFSHEETKKRHPFVFMPFGEGPRVCIGQRFGMLQTKVGLAVLMKNHKFTLSQKTVVPITMDPKGLIFQVKGGIWLKAERDVF